jgi:hypothetical protein
MLAIVPPGAASAAKAVPAAFLFILVLLMPADALGERGGNAGSISILAPREMLEHPVIAVTVRDVLGLLKSAFPEVSVSLNDAAAEVRLVLSRAKATEGPRGKAKRRAGSLLAYPDHWYEWKSGRQGDAIVLALRSPSEEGLSFGLYGLLAEKLGFRFYHPRRTLVPEHHRWPLPEQFLWKAAPRFETRGFHIHTQHPVEMTEALLDPGAPQSFPSVREYIDWLARNGQNAFQFFLLRGVDRARWPDHAKRIVEYAHSRGIRVGVEVSLSMLQQKAFQIVKLLSWRRYTRQADETLAWLMRASWDFVTLDLSMGEYQPDLGRLMPGLRDYVVRTITERYGRSVMFTTHVIPSAEAESSAGSEPRTGVLIHTVMCYGIDEPSARVYGNNDQRHMLTRAAREAKRRETWYWPESSYWVAFDNPVPVLFLTYLSARWSDMNTMEKIGIDGHMTFSSGWEWGYWLVDWSISRWSWRSEEEGAVRRSHPLSALMDLFPDGRSTKLWKEAFDLQQEYFKDHGLIPFMAAADPSAELFWPFNKPFQPRLPFTLRWLLSDASDREIEGVLRGPVDALKEYSRKMSGIVRALREHSARSTKEPAQLQRIRQELLTALEVTALRAEHRSLTLKALIALRREKNAGDADALLREAATVRLRAQKLVQRQEGLYRYPLSQIARPAKNHTAYRFGYLWPASDLHFWKREEEQVRRQRFDAFFMNIWDFWDVVGV